MDFNCHFCRIITSYQTCQGGLVAVIEVKGCWSWKNDAAWRSFPIHWRGRCSWILSETNCCISLTLVDLNIHFDECSSEGVIYDTILNPQASPIIQSVDWWNFLANTNVFIWYFAAFAYPRCSVRPRLSIFQNIICTWSKIYIKSIVDVDVYSNIWIGLN